MRSEILDGATFRWRNGKELYSVVVPTAEQCLLLCEMAEHLRREAARERALDLLCPGRVEDRETMERLEWLEAVEQAFGVGGNSGTGVSPWDH